MSKQIWVQVAGTDRRVPVEEHGGYFEHGVPHFVRDTDFVRQLIREGDLIEVEAPVDGEHA